MSKLVLLILQLYDSWEDELNFLLQFLPTLGFEVVGNRILNAFCHSFNRISPLDLLVHCDYNFTVVTVDLSWDKAERYLDNVHSGNCNLVF